MAAGNRPRYARVARIYDFLDAPFEPLYRRGRRLIGVASVGLTFELGAGTGKNFAYYGPGARVIAADLSWAMLARARQRQRPPVRALLLSDATHLPLRDTSVDTVTATFVCCVQVDPRDALAEIARILRPDGRLLLLEYVLPPTGALRGLMRLLEPPLRALYGIHWEPDLVGLLPPIGLRLVRLQPIWRSVVIMIVATKDRRARASSVASTCLEGSEHVPRA